MVVPALWPRSSGSRPPAQPSRQQGHRCSAAPGGCHFLGAEGRVHNRYPHPHYFIIVVVIIIIILSHSLLADVHFGIVFGHFFFFPASSSNFSCNSSYFNSSTASVPSENSVLERVISCSWESVLGLRSTSVTSMFFPKSTCSPGARHPNSFSGFQTANSWDRDNKWQISKGKPNMHHFTQTSPQTSRQRKLLFSLFH